MLVGHSERLEGINKEIEQIWRIGGFEAGKGRERGMEGGVVLQ